MQAEHAPDPGEGYYRRSPTSHTGSQIRRQENCKKKKSKSRLFPFTASKRRSFSYKLFIPFNIISARIFISLCVRQAYSMPTSPIYHLFSGDGDCIQLMTGEEIRFVFAFLPSLF